MFGNRFNLPSRLDSYENQSDIIYWSSPRQDQSIFQAVYLESVGVFTYFPCLWPHIVVLSPCFCGGACATKIEAEKTDVVLTSNKLELIVDGVVTKTIVLDHIKSIIPTSKSLTQNAPTCCIPDVNRIIIDDGRIRYSKHGKPIPMLTTIWAHENIEEFVRVILETKEKRQSRDISLQNEHTGKVYPEIEISPPVY